MSRSRARGAPRIACTRMQRAERHGMLLPSLQREDESAR